MSISVPLAVAVVITTVAALVDIRDGRIPNWLTLTACCAGLALNVWQVGVVGLAVALGGAALGLAISLPVYLLKGRGAGDVKLLAAVGALVGPQVLVSVAVYGALVGGVLSAAALAKRGRLVTTLNALMVGRGLRSPGSLTTPHAVAIASGVYLSLVLPEVIR